MHQNPRGRGVSPFYPLRPTCRGYGFDARGGSVSRNVRLLRGTHSDGTPADLQPDRLPQIADGEENAPENTHLSCASNHTLLLPHIESDHYLGDAAVWECPYARRAGK